MISKAKEVYNFIKKETMQNSNTPERTILHFREENKTENLEAKERQRRKIEQELETDIERLKQEAKKKLIRLNDDIEKQKKDFSEFRDVLIHLRKNELKPEDKDHVLNFLAMSKELLKNLKTENPRLLPEIPETEEPESFPEPVERTHRTEPEEAPEKGAAVRILVVEDDPTTVKIISHFLRMENYAVTSASTGEEGLAAAYKERPDLILLDLMMPVMSGFQMLMHLKKDKQMSKIPIIIISALSQETDILKGMKAGAMDYVSKPFSPQVLLAKITKILER